MRTIETMEPITLLMKLEGVKKIWTGNATLSLDEHERPYLEGFYQLREHGKTIQPEYRYTVVGKKGIWKKTKE